MAFAGPLAFYIATLTPGVGFWDVGEMQTVPYLLGIPHPTGFPFFVIAAWVASHAVPLGEPAWRISLFCAIASAASAWLAWYLVRDVTRSGLLGLAAALVFAAGDIVWTRAIRAEVHDLALLCITLAIVAARRAGETRGRAPLVVAAVACGFGLATHPVTVFAIPCLVIVAWPTLRAVRPAALAGVVACGCVPLLSYAYLPLRSAYVERHALDPNVDLGMTGNALFDDGSPSSPSHFLRYVSGATFSPANALRANFTSAGLAHVAAFCSTVFSLEFGVPLLVFAALGFAVLAVRRARLGIGFATLIVSTAAFAANYPNEVDAQRYALPALWATVCCAAFGVHAIALAILRERSRSTGAVCAAMLLVTLWPRAPAAYADMLDRKAFGDARDLGPAIVRHTNDGSLLVATWNFATPLIYDRYVERSLGSRRVVCGWPPSFADRLPRWHTRFHHVYFVVNTRYDVTTMGRRVYQKGRWQIVEMS